MNTNNNIKRHYRCDVIICDGQPEPNREEILSKSEGVDGILWATHELLNAEALNRAGPQLKVVSTKSAGNKTKQFNIVGVVNKHN